MKTKEIIFKQLMKRGYSIRNDKRVWDLSDSKLWYLTPELSQGFLNMYNYEPYKKKVVDTELELLKNHNNALLALFGVEKFNLIDLGCGDGKKAAVFIESMPKNIKLNYCPLDISKDFLDKATKEISKLNSGRINEIKAKESCFEDLDSFIASLRSGDYAKNIILFLGETISHYEVTETLFNISNAMLPGDVIVIGNGYRKGERFVDAGKYKDKLFDKWFINILLGVGLHESDIEYDARFENGRLEFFYKMKIDKIIENEGKKISFKKGDEIVVGCQYKYFEEEWEDFCNMYFKVIGKVKDEKKEYSLYVCQK